MHVANSKKIFHDLVVSYIVFVCYETAKTLQTTDLFIQLKQKKNQAGICIYASLA